MKLPSIFRIAGITLVVVAVAIMYYFLPLRSWATMMLIWIRGFGSDGALIYGFVYVVAVLFLPASLLTAGAGLVYGPVVGVLIVSPASVIGSTLAFLVARYFGRDWVKSRIATQPKLGAIQRRVESNGFKLVLLLRLQPILPFVLLNYALGLTRLRLRDYLLASWIGMLPGTILYVYLGSALGNIDELFCPGALHHSALSRFFFGAGLVAAGLLAVWAGRLGRAALRQELEHRPEQERSLA